MTFFLTKGSINADTNNFNIPPIIVHSILNSECLIKNNKYYPFFIRINNKKDIKKLKKLGYKVKNHCILCENKKKCSVITTKLVKNGITNIDLGPFQMNYRFYKFKDKTTYFDYALAKKEIEKILKNLIKTYGYSWTTLARYHSGTKKHNQKYAKKLKKFIKENQGRYN